MPVEIGAILLSFLQKPIELLKLASTDRRLNFCKTKVVSDQIGDVFNSHALDGCLGMVPNELKALRELFVFCNDDCAFSRMNVLIKIERIDTDVGKRSH